MKRLTLVFLLLTFCATAFAGESQLQKATNVMNEIMSTPDRGIPHDLLDKAVCVGIVPSEIKFAFGFGGTYGRGVLVCRIDGTVRPTHAAQGLDGTLTKFSPSGGRTFASL